MFTIDEQRALHDKAVELLEKALTIAPDTRLHQKLGDIYLNKKKDPEKAIEHFSTALK